MLRTYTFNKSALVRGRSTAPATQPPHWQGRRGVLLTDLWNLGIQQSRSGSLAFECHRNSHISDHWASPMSSQFHILSMQSAYSNLLEDVPNAIPDRPERWSERWQSTSLRSKLEPQIIDVPYRGPRETKLTTGRQCSCSSHSKSVLFHSRTYIILAIYVRV